MYWHLPQATETMSNNMRDLVMGEADVDSEEDDESYDEDTGEARERERKPRERVDDSSEEEDDDDDEEEAAKVGFSIPAINNGELETDIWHHFRSARALLSKTMTKSLKIQKPNENDESGRDAERRLRKLN